MAIKLNKDLIVDGVKINNRDVPIGEILKEGRIGNDSMKAICTIRNANKITNVDLNTFLNVGSYALYGNCTGAPEDGKAMSNGYGTLFVQEYSDSHIIQTLFCSQWDGSKARIFVRATNGEGPTFGVWSEITTQPSNAYGSFKCVYNVYGNSFDAGTGDNYLIIRTPARYDTNVFYRIVIEGYLYRNQSPLHVELCFYTYNNSIVNSGWWGIGPDEVKLCQHQDASGKHVWIQLHFKADNYFTFFKISEFSCNNTNIVNDRAAWYSMTNTSPGTYTGNTYNVSRKT